MNGEKFQKMLDALRLTQEEAAVFFDANPRTIRRYVLDEHPVNGCIEKLGIAMIRLGLLPKDIDRMVAADASDITVRTAKERKRLLLEAAKRRKDDEYVDDVQFARGAHMAGVSYSDIGGILGVSKQRVHQMVKGP